MRVKKLTLNPEKMDVLMVGLVLTLGDCHQMLDGGSTPPEKEGKGGGERHGG